MILVPQVLVNFKISLFLNFYITNLVIHF